MSGYLATHTHTHTHTHTPAGKRNGIASVVAGGLFFSAWWLMLDTAAVYEAKDWSNVSDFEEH